MKQKLKLAIGADHAGFALKEFLMAHTDGVEWVDYGPKNADRVDYPDFAEKVARAVSKADCALGVLICGSGIGMSISANKIEGVRAAVVESDYAARLSRQHNDANVLCLGARILGAEYARDILRAWLDASFEGGRHADRVRKIALLEKPNHGTRKPS